MSVGKYLLPCCCMGRCLQFDIQHDLIPKSLILALAPPVKILSEYDQEIPQSQTADNHMAPRRRAAQPSRDTRKTN